MKERPLFVSLFGVLCLQGGCETTDPAGPEPGPCFHQYEEAVLHIRSVKAVGNGAPIAAVRLSDITLDGNASDLFDLLFAGSRVAVLDTTLICNPPCSFGTGEGLYSFRVSADGYHDTTVVIVAGYSIFEGGCPSRSTGGTRIDIELRATTAE